MTPPPSAEPAHITLQRPCAVAPDLRYGARGEKTMRSWGVAILVGLAACQQQSKPPTIGFDGAQASGAAAVLAHGERLTHVLGCTGCHGVHLEGTFFTKDEPQYGPLYASNLSVELPGFSDAQIEDVLRKGVHPERKTGWGMPSEIFQHLSASDMKALIAYLRSI